MKNQDEIIMTSAMNQVIKDLSLDNWDNLFKGETRHNLSSWLVLRPNLKRKTDYSITEGEWKYRISYNIDKKELWIGSYDNIFKNEDGKKILSLLVSLDEQYEKELKEKKEQQKLDFLKKNVLRE